jgi:hypothetical protein
MLRSSVLRMICDSRLRLVPAIEILSGSVNIVMNWMSTSLCNKSKRRDQKLLRLRVLVELFARSPILIEDKQVWIVIAHMEMVVHARGFGTRRLDEAMKHVLEGRVPFGA